MNKTQEKKSSLLLVLSVVFLDLLGFGIALPIIAPLLVSGEILGNTSHEFRNIMLGVLLASYAVAQFLGSPILGSLSDKYGRKPVLIASIAGNGVGYVLFAVGILTTNIWLLFGSRILAGFTGGNIAVAQSVISDISAPHEKTKNFGLIGMAFGLGFILGPFLGGLLSNSSLVSWFSYAIPFFFAAGLSLLNLLYVTYFFHETLHTRVHIKLSILTGVRNIRTAFKLENVRSMFLVVFVFTLGFSFFNQFFQVFLIDKFAYTPAEIGNVFGFMGLCIALTQGLITRYIAKRVTSKNVLSITYFGSAICIFLMIIPSNPAWLYPILAVMAVFNGLTMANMTSVVSELAGKESQGEILGINQSLQSLGMAIPPVIAGVLVSLWIALPIILASVFLVLAGVLFVILVKRAKTTEKFHEV